MVVSGNIDATAASTLTKTEDAIYVFGSVSPNVAQDVNAVKSFTDLAIDHPDIYTLLTHGTLPITLKYQRLKNQGEHILVEFETTEEINSAHVELQWSVDGVNWISLEVLESRSPSIYRYEHYLSGASTLIDHIGGEWELYLTKNSRYSGK